MTQGSQGLAESTIPIPGGPDHVGSHLGLGPAHWQG